MTIQQITVASCFFRVSVANPPIAPFSLTWGMLAVYRTILSGIFGQACKNQVISGNNNQKRIFVPVHTLHQFSLLFYHPFNHPKSTTKRQNPVFFGILSFDCLFHAYKINPSLTSAVHLLSDWHTDSRCWSLLRWSVAV